MALLIGLDLGTTSCKAVALTAEGRLLAAASTTYSLQWPQPGWAEQDVWKVWRGTAEALQALAAQLLPAQVTGICLSGAMHSLFPVDDEATPLAPAMAWADNRAAPQATALSARTDPHTLYQRTGCPLCSTYHVARLRWWFEQALQVAQRATRFIAIKDWILHRLTGVWATDLSMASATGLLDIHRLAWDEEALSLAGVSVERLPPLVVASTVVGELTKRAADETGLPAGIPVVAGGSDGGLANLGAGAVTSGQVVVTVGTSGAIRRVLDYPWLDEEERTWCYVLMEGRWFAGGAINNGGLALQWVRERFYPELPAEAGYEQLLTDAAAIPPGAGGVLMLPYFTGERSPHWNAAARAIIYGLGLEHSRAHVARATLEAVAFCLADVWQALAEGNEPAEPARLTGGIVRAPIWVQILADVLGIPLAPVQIADASALGAAILGHWALGNIPALAEGGALPRLDLILEPDPQRHAFYSARHQAFQSLYRRLL